MVTLLRAHRLGDLAPAEVVLFHSLEQLRVLLLALGALSDGVRDAVVPALSEFLVFAAREVGRDFVTAGGTDVGGL